MTTLFTWLWGLSIIAVVVVFVSIPVIRMVWRRFIPLGFSVADIFDMSAQLSTSASQLQKAYDWTISQWSSFANAVLAATLGFISTCVVELYKESFKKPHLSIAMAAGIGVSLWLYIRCEIKINELRNEFIYLYELLL